MDVSPYDTVILEIVVQVDGIGEIRMTTEPMAGLFANDMRLRFANGEHLGRVVRAKIKRAPRQGDAR